MSLKSEALNRVIFFGDKSLRNAVGEYLFHYHQERNHQGLENKIIDPGDEVGTDQGNVERRERLGGLLNYYHRAAQLAAKSCDHSPNQNGDLFAQTEADGNDSAGLGGLATAILDRDLTIFTHANPNCQTVSGSFDFFDHTGCQFRSTASPAR